MEPSSSSLSLSLSLRRRKASSEKWFVPWRRFSIAGSFWDGTAAIRALLADSRARHPRHGGAVKSQLAAPLTGPGPTRQALR